MANINVDLMRKIDLWVGVPACYLLSALNLIARPFKSRQKRPVKKILFLQISEMGSAVEVRPSLQYIKKKHPDAEIYYLIFKEMADIVNIMGLVPKENIFTIRSKSIPLLLKDTFSAARKLRKEKIDVIIDLELFSRFSSILSYLSGARIKIGFNKFHMEGLYRGNFHTHKVLYNPHQHISLNFLALVNSLDSPEDDFPHLKKKLEHDFSEFYIKSSENEKRAILQKLKAINQNINKSTKIIILNPNTSALLPLRKWPLKYYCELAKKILQDKDVSIVLTGTVSEKSDAVEICNYVKDKRCIDFMGKTTLKELIDLYNLSDALISNDSGPPHFASLTPIKIFVFFGPETPELYAPLSKNLTVFYSNFACSPCVSAYNHRKSPCNNNKCLQAISVNEVYNSVKKYLDTKK